MENSQSISLSMIVKNEERYLRDCLDSVKDLVDEIVIVDTGSTDDTEKIAKEYNARLYHFDWINDFSAARNFALRKSTGDWILYLDADERLAGHSIENIKQLTSSNTNALIGVKCMVNSIDDKYGKPKLMKYARLFKNSPYIQFTGRVHEQIEESLLSNKYKIIDSDIEIIHIGYNIEYHELKEKAKRNLDLLLKEYRENNSSYYAFQLGNTYLILGDLDKAINYFHIALEDNKLDKVYRAICYLNIADYYNSELYDIVKAEASVIQGINNDPSNPLLSLLASQIFFKAGKKDKAISFCKDALSNNKKLSKRNGNNSTILSIALESERIISYGLYLSFICQNNISLEYFLKEGSTEYQTMISLLLNKSQLNNQEIDLICTSINNNNLEFLLFLLEKSKDREASLKILKSVKYNFTDNPKFLIVLGNLFIEQKLSEDGINAFKESLKLKSKDPSAIFYLISALVGHNRLFEIPEWLLFAENEFGHISIFNEKFNILKKKLEALIK